MALTLAKTKAGFVSGVEIPGRDMTVFRGIPFAAPPVGELRWKEPQPVQPWEGVRKAEVFMPPAWQLMHEKNSFYDREWENEPFTCSEDCLYLNVWTPAKSADAKLPVAVWIFGGGFRSGFPHEREFDGEAFAAKDVVFVSVNYRLSIFGYLAHEDLEDEAGHSGNYGTLDQVAALKWVHENIAEFGGDPGNVMVFGQSAGATSTITMFCSPLTKGLVHKVVVHSGLGGFKTKESAYDVGRQFAEHCGCKSPKELKDVPAEKLMEYYSDFHPVNGKSTRHGLDFFPYVDGYALTETYEESMEKGSYNDVQFMMGSTRDDMAGGKPFPWMPAAIHDGMSEFLLKHEENGKKPGYLYFFTHPLPGDDSGCWHSCDLWYIHGTLDRCWRPFDAFDYRLSDTMVTYWTNFLKYGDPNGEGLPLWKPHTKAEKNTMIFGTGSIAMGEPDITPNLDPESARWRIIENGHM